MATKEEQLKLLKKTVGKTMEKTPVNKGAMMLAASPKAIAGLKAFAKTPAAKILGRAIPGFSVVSVLAGVANFIKKKDDNTRAMSPGPKKKRSKAKSDREKAVFERKKRNIQANKEVRSIKETRAIKKAKDEKAAATRESFRGKTGKRNVIKNKFGDILKTKDGKVVRPSTEAQRKARLKLRREQGK